MYVYCGAPASARLASLETPSSSTASLEIDAAPRPQVKVYSDSVRASCSGLLIKFRARYHYCMLHASINSHKRPRVIQVKGSRVYRS